MNPYDEIAIRKLLKNVVYMRSLTRPVMVTRPTAIIPRTLIIEAYSCQL